MDDDKSLSGNTDYHQSLLRFFTSESIYYNVFYLLKNEEKKTNKHEAICHFQM